MALTLISEIGGQVILGDYADETIVPAIADGTAKAGWVVGITAAGSVGGTDTGAPDFFTGFLLPNHTIDVDTAITVSLPVSVVIPKSGHLYGIVTTDLSATGSGLPMTFSATAGAWDVVAAVEGASFCRTYEYTSGDTVAVVIWN